MDHDSHVRHISLAREFPTKGIPLKGKCASQISLAREFPCKGNFLAKGNVLHILPKPAERRREEDGGQGSAGPLLAGRAGRGERLESREYYLCISSV
jgi:hypothetical protein